MARAGLSILSATHNASVAAEVSECKESFDLAQDADEDETEEEEDDDLIQKTLREQGEMRWRQVRPDDFEDDNEDDEDGYLGARNVQFHPPPTGFKAEVDISSWFVMKLYSAYFQACLSPHWHIQTPHSVTVQITGSHEMGS